MFQPLRYGKSLSGSTSRYDINMHLRQDDMSVEPAPKVFIQNKLAKCRNKLQELGPLINTKRMSFIIYDVSNKQVDVI